MERPMRALLRYLNRGHRLRAEQAEHEKTKAAYRFYKDLYWREREAHRELMAQTIMEGA
jgi:hypothetical protein